MVGYDCRNECFRGIYSEVFMMTRLVLNMVLNISAVAETRSLTELFGSDPVSWLNWVLVFGVLALSFYLLVFKLWSKINYFFSCV